MIGRHSFLRRCGGLVALAAVLSGCDSAPPVAETPPPPVTVSQPLVREVTDSDEYEGRIAARDSVEVRARVRGHLIKVAFEDGKMVKEGDLLVEIDPRPYQATLHAAEAQKASAEAALELAKSEYARTVVLARTGSASREELEVWKAKQAIATADRLKALAAVEQAQLDLDFTKVAAPISGKASRAQVTVGNLVNGSGGETLLTTLVSVDPMYVYFDVDERSLVRYRKDYLKGKPDQDANKPPIKELKIPVEVAIEGEEGFPQKGVIDFADNRVNASTGTIQVRGVIPNPRGLLDPGMRARVRVAVGDPQERMMIAEQAIGTEQGRKFVYVVNDQDVVERRDVRPDRVFEGMQVIEGALKPTDWVIINGIQRVRDGIKVQPRRVSRNTTKS
jgi:multidrug efflux system membrane fusion protein